MRDSPFLFLWGMPLSFGGTPPTLSWGDSSPYPFLGGFSLPFPLGGSPGPSFPIFVRGIIYGHSMGKLANQNPFPFSFWDPPTFLREIPTYRPSPCLGRSPHALSFWRIPVSRGSGIPVFREFPDSRVLFKHIFNERYHAKSLSKFQFDVSFNQHVL